jgi:cytochrome c biogenesis protein ResB
MEPVEPVREDRTPALLLELRTAKHSRQMWVQKFGSRPVTVDGKQYELSYSNRRVPLDFSITLDHFHIGYYPGGMRPRSFESHVTIADPATGRTRSQVISMNHPVKHGGYSFYQSSFREGPQRTASFLSVSHDPGQPIVFAGYIIVLVGMVAVLWIRMADRRKAERPTRVTGLT